MRPYSLNSHKFSNQFKSGKNSFPNRLAGPLSNEQKASICILAKTAADAVGVSFINTAHAREWRQEQQYKAVGKQSLTECVQDDFLPIRAHFLNLAGQSAVAMNMHLKHDTEPKRIAMHKLTEACARAGKPLAYAAAICRSKNKCALDEANVKQIWQLVFTIKNRTPKQPSRPIKDDNIPF